MTRSAGCVINDYADRDLDPEVARTRDRPLAAGRVAPAEALFLFVALGLVAVWLALQLDPYAQLFAVAGAVLAVTYPWLKRIVHVPQFYLGVAFGWSIPMAFAALTGEVPKIAWLLLTAVVLWAAVYDTMYAMVDREDDERIGVKSTAILFGEADRLIVAVMMAMTLLALWLAGNEAGLRRLVSRRPGRGGDLLPVRAVADPAPRAEGLLPGLQQQPLRRARRLRRARARLSLPLSGFADGTRDRPGLDAPATGTLQRLGRAHRRSRPSSARRRRSRRRAARSPRAPRTRRAR